MRSGILVVEKPIISKEESMNMLYSYPKITQEDIESLNSQLRMILPLEFTNFLLEHNGGQPKRKIFPAQKGRKFTFNVEALYGIGPKGENDNDFLMMYSNHCEIVPDELFPIGDNGIGDLICIGVQGEYYGKVYYWYRDGRVGEDETPNFDNVDLLTNSFTEFLEMLE